MELRDEHPVPPLPVVASTPVHVPSHVPPHVPSHVPSHVAPHGPSHVPRSREELISRYVHRVEVDASHVACPIISFRCSLRAVLPVVLPLSQCRHDPIRSPYHTPRPRPRSCLPRALLNQHLHRCRRRPWLPCLCSHQCQSPAVAQLAVSVLLPPRRRCSLPQPSSAAALVLHARLRRRRRLQRPALTAVRPRVWRATGDAPSFQMSSHRQRTTRASCR